MSWGTVWLKEKTPGDIGETFREEMVYLACNSRLSIIAGKSRQNLKAITSTVKNRIKNHMDHGFLAFSQLPPLLYTSGLPSEWCHP